MTFQEIVDRIRSGETFYGLQNGNRLLQYRGYGHLVLFLEDGSSMSTTHALTRMDLTRTIVQKFLEVVA